MTALRERMVSALREAGLPAAAARSWDTLGRIRENQIWVALGKTTAKAGAMRAYLGTDAAGEERYGMQLEAEFRLSLTTPTSAGAAGCDAFGDAVWEVLLLGMPGMEITGITAAETVYEKVFDGFQKDFTVNCPVMACGERTDAGMTISGFTVEATVRGCAI